MSLRSPRADSLPLIRDFVVAISQGVVRQLSDFGLVKPSWSRTRCYHYWSAMRDLGFAKLEKSKVVILPLGSRLVKVAQFGRFEPSGKLNVAEMEIFKESFLKYEPIREFLSYFISTGEYFRNYKQLKEHGAPVLIKRHPQDIRGIVLVDASNSERVFPAAKGRAIRWSLKFWCQEVGIIDEIWLEKEAWYSRHLVENNIPERILFPIKMTVETVDLATFQEMLDSIIQQERTNYIIIPILTYYFCKTYFVAVKDFHSKLVELHRSNPYRYYLEKGSIVDIKENVRTRGHANYPRVDGYLRNYLIVRNKESNYVKRN